MITRKTYIKAAKIVKEKRDHALTLSKISLANQIADLEYVAYELETAFIELFQGDNPKFNKEKFLDACGSDK